MHLFKGIHSTKDNKNWLVPFLFGFAFGILLIFLWGESYLSEDGILGNNSLGRLQYIEISCGKLFIYALKQRLSTIFIIALLSSTFFGIIAIYTFVAWMGFSIGVLFTVAATRFGARGILFIFASIFPHYIIYIPVFIILINVCYELCTKLYFPERCFGSIYNGKKQLLLHFACYITLLSLVTIIGVLLESYVNSYIIVKFMKFILI